MPLRPVEFHILLALASEERHGYGLLQEVASLTEGDLQLEPGTLYRAAGGHGPRTRGLLVKRTARARWRPASPEPFLSVGGRVFANVWNHWVYPSGRAIITYHSQINADT